MTAPIVLMTDFGTRDSYVGVMKGVITGIAPNVSIADAVAYFAIKRIRRWL